MKFPKVSPEIAHTFEKSLRGATKGNTLSSMQTGYLHMHILHSFHLGPERS